MRITYYGHSCFLIEADRASLLIDPFLSGNAKASISADQVTADFILLTHGHGDHLGDTVAIARRSGATVVANFEICNWLGRQGVENCHAQNIGGGFNYPWGRLQLTVALHSSALPDGSYGGNPGGLRLTIDGKTIYHAGDTSLFSDMKLIGEGGLDLALLPIGDNYTMGPTDALRAVHLLQPATVIPIHYNTFPVIAQDPGPWAAQVETQTNSRVVLLQPGQSWCL